MNPLFRIDFSISDSLKIVRKSVLIYETIIAYCRTTLTQKAQHGYSEEFPEMRASFMITGTDIKPGHIEGVRLIDVAPTLAAIMGISLPDAEGKNVLEQGAEA